jgi:hypothetical protein
MLESITAEVFRNFLLASGVLVAVVSVLTARTIARKKQTADLLFATRSDQTLQEGYRLVVEYSQNTNKNIRALAAAGPPSDDAKKFVMY